MSTRQNKHMTFQVHGTIQVHGIKLASSIHLHGIMSTWRYEYMALQVHGNKSTTHCSHGRASAWHSMALRVHGTWQHVIQRMARICKICVRFSNDAVRMSHMGIRIPFLLDRTTFQLQRYNTSGASWKCSLSSWTASGHSSAATNAPVRRKRLGVRKITACNHCGHKNNPLEYLAI